MQDFTCKFMHFRLPEYATRGGELLRLGPTARGGATLAYEVRDGLLYGAIAYCNPSDNFNHKYGRNKANGRLQQLLFGTREKDHDKYFVLPEESGLDTIASFLIDGMGYFRRGPRK